MYVQTQDHPFFCPSERIEFPAETETEIMFKAMKICKITQPSYSAMEKIAVLVLRTNTAIFSVAQ